MSDALKIERRSADRHAPIARPVLANRKQVAMEKLLLELWSDQDVMALRRELEGELSQLPTARHPDGAITLPRAVCLYTSSCISSEITAHSADPAFFWWEDVPHTIGGHTVAGVGIAGDTPDHIYRRVTVDGAHTYRLTGRIDLSSRPAFIFFEVMRGRIGPIALSNQGRSADMGNFVGSLSDLAMDIAPDGSFSIDIGGDRGERRNWLPLAEGDNTIMVREITSDWNQRAARLDIEQVTGERPAPATFEELKARVLATLPDYVRFWGNWHNVSREGIEPNTLKGILPRDGGFGYVAHLRYSLGEDEAVLLRLRSGGARYFGVHATDPWQITDDARHFQVTLNNTQARVEPDGTYSFVISPRDPGVANWVDTAGMHNGYVILRWQGAPPDFPVNEVITDFCIAGFDVLQQMPGLVHVPPADRALTRLASGLAYARRAVD